MFTFTGEVYHFIVRPSSERIDRHGAVGRGLSFGDSSRLILGVRLSLQRLMGILTSSSAQPKLSVQRSSSPELTYLHELEDWSQESWGLGGLHTTAGNSP